MSISHARVAVRLALAFGVVCLVMSLSAAVGIWRLAGLQDFLPPQVARPRSGRGPVHAVVALTQGRLSNVRLELDLRNVTLDLPVR